MSMNYKHFDCLNEDQMLSHCLLSPYILEWKKGGSNHPKLFLESTQQDSPPVLDNCTITHTSHL